MLTSRVGALGRKRSFSEVLWFWVFFFFGVFVVVVVVSCCFLVFWNAGACGYLCQIKTTVKASRKGSSFQ